MAPLLFPRMAAALGVAAIVSAHQAPQPPSFLAKAPDSIRLLTWNIYRDSIFPTRGQKVDVAAASRPARFARVVRAVRPDIVCLQQVTLGAVRTVALLNEIDPLKGGRTWRAHAGADTVVASRFDITGRDEGRVAGADGPRGHAIAMLRTPSTDLYVVCGHFQSSDGTRDAALRQQQADMVVRAVRDAEAGRGTVRMAPRTPFVLLGDFNAIPGGTSFLDSIVSSGLDWDQSSLTDAQPHHNAAREETYTWRNDREPYPPSALDRIVYSDSVLTSVNQFVLDTMAMTYDEAISSQLRVTDVMRDPQTGIHDHLPLVIDVAVKKSAPPEPGAAPRSAVASTTARSDR